MRTHNISKEMHTATIRAGVISLSVFTLCYLWMTGGTGFLSAWLFIISFAVCFVLMISSVVDLLVLAFAVAARFSGIGLGRSVRLVRRIYRRLRLSRNR